MNVSSWFGLDAMHHFTVFDYVVLTIVLLSILLGVLRGMVKEVLSLLNWVLAFWVANRFGDSFAVSLGGIMELGSLNESMRMLLGCAIAFLATMLVGAVITALLGRIITAAGLGFADRLLGAVFGLARGFFIVFVLVVGAGFTTLPQQPFWRDAVLSPLSEDVVRSAKPYLPHNVEKWVRY